MAMVFNPIAPTTLIGLNADQSTITIAHIFPLSKRIDEVVSCFVNKAQGFAVTRVTVPTVDLLALAALIKAHVPREHIEGPRASFQQTGITVDTNLLTCTLGLMRSLSADERTNTDEVRTHHHEVRKASQILAFTVTLPRAHDIAATIDAITPGILRALAEQLPDAPPAV
ncbi:MAG: hypothetical protein AAB473_01320 [Patescibacteria group bacterium]